MMYQMVFPTISLQSWVAALAEAPYATTGGTRYCSASLQFHLILEVSGTYKKTLRGSGLWTTDNKSPSVRAEVFNVAHES
jgi:hypothetical protein